MIYILELAAGTILAGMLLYGLYLGGKRLLGWFLTNKSMSPAAIRNKKREEVLLNKILADISNNSDHWFIVEEHHASSVLANDKKNMGIVYNTGESATILLNLDQLTKFEKNNADTVKIHVQGDHVKAFVHKAEAMIDRRGNEISFFEEQMEKRL